MQNMRCCAPSASRVPLSRNAKDGIPRGANSGRLTGEGTCREAEATDTEEGAAPGWRWAPAIMTSVPGARRSGDGTPATASVAACARAPCAVRVSSLASSAASAAASAATCSPCPAPLQHLHCLFPQQKP